MLKSLTLREHMLSNPVRVHPDDNLLDAMQVIIDNRISGVCVVEGDATLVGILSELDCLHAVLNASYNHDKVGRVRDHMATSNLVVAHPNEAVLDVAQDMLRKHKRRRPVIENGRLIGQVTCRQLLRVVKSFSETPPSDRYSQP